MEKSADIIVEALLVKGERDLVEVRRVDRAHHGFLRHVALERDLALERGRDRPVAAAHDHVGLDAAAAELGDRVLGRLRLLLSRRVEIGHEGDVDVADAVAPHVLAELPDGLEERQDLDVADRATDLGDDHVDVLGRQPQDATLDLVGDVRDHLHRLTEEVAVPLPRQHRLIDRARRGVRVAVQVLVDEALVVPEVEVGLAAVLGDIDLAVLERVHRAGVDVDVGVELLHGDAQAPALQQPAKRGCRQPLAQRARHSARDEDVFGHGRPPYLALPRPQGISPRVPNGRGRAAAQRRR